MVLPPVKEDVGPGIEGTRLREISLRQRVGEKHLLAWRKEHSVRKGKTGSWSSNETKSVNQQQDQRKGLIPGFRRQPKQQKLLPLPQLSLDPWKSLTSLISSLLWGGRQGHWARQKGSGFIPSLNTLLLAVCSCPCAGKVMTHVLFSQLVAGTNWAPRLLLSLKHKAAKQSDNVVILSKGANKN